MNKQRMTSFAVVFLATTSVLANDHVGLSDGEPLTRLTNYRFTEADLKQLERVHVTSTTTDVSRLQDMQLTTNLDQTSQQIENGPLFQWTDTSGKRWGVSVDDTSNPHGLKSNAPIITAGEVTDDIVQRTNEVDSIPATSIPEPASLAMATISLALIYPYRNKKTLEHPSTR